MSELNYPYRVTLDVLGAGWDGMWTGGEGGVLNASVELEVSSGGGDEGDIIGCVD